MRHTIYKIIISSLILSFVFISCSMEDLQDNPNYPTEGTPSLLLPRLIEQTFYDGNQVGPGAAAQLLFYTERAESDQYWGWSTTSMGGYETIKQAALMEDASEKIEHKTYAAIANLFKQINFYYITRAVGDIPYSESLKALDGNFTPKYDTQKFIFQSIFTELDNINKVLSENNNEVISGDILYNGDIIKWQKLTNSFKLKILMDLSMKENDPEMNIKTQFSDIFNNPSEFPIFESNQDMLRFKFYDLINNRAPTYDRTTTKVQTKLTSTLVDHLVNTTDYRLFKFAEPSWPDNSNQWTDEERLDFRNKFESYSGLDPAGVWGDEVKKNSSNIHWRYHDNPTVEDYSKFSFSELNLIIAEACAREWINGDAEFYYKKGVEASMKFFDVSDSDINCYWENALSIFDYDNAIEQINMQRWIAYFMNSNWEAYYNNRRTKAHKMGADSNGIPSLKVSQTHYVTQAPMRWMYPQSEYNTNEDNVSKAVKDQFGKDDESQFDLIWMLRD